MHRALFALALVVVPVGAHAGGFECGPELTAHGECVPGQNILRFCSDGIVFEEDCGARFEGSRCGLASEEAGYFCIAPVGGACVTDGLKTACDEGAVCLMNALDAGICEAMKMRCDDLPSDVEEGSYCLNSKTVAVDCAGETPLVLPCGPSSHCKDGACVDEASANSRPPAGLTVVDDGHRVRCNCTTTPLPPMGAGLLLWGALVWRIGRRRDRRRI